MSVQASFLGPGAGYWPMGDVYPLTPLWSELHVGQEILPVDESALTYNHVIPFGFPWFVEIELTDLGTILDTYPSWYPNAAAFEAAAAVDDTIPTGYVRTESVIRKTWGWSTSFSFTATQVLDDDDVWTGRIKLGVDVALQRMLGFGEAVPFHVRCIFNDGTADYPVYTMVGYLVVRP